MENLLVFGLLIAVFGSGLSALAEVNLNPGSESFICGTEDAGAKIIISGEFSSPDPEVWTKHGTLSVYFPNTLGPSIESLPMAFNRGAWTTDRLSFFIRKADGGVESSVQVEDYFSSDGTKALSAVVSGDLGQRKLGCQRFLGEVLSQ